MKLHKVSGFAAVAAFVFAFAFSSTASAQGAKVGVKGGADMANFVGDDADFSGQVGSGPSSISTSNAPKIGFNAGLQAVIGFTPMFGLQPEIAYTQKGHKITVDEVDASATITYNYLEIPILGRLAFDLPGAPITPKALLGPTFGYFMSGSLSAEGPQGSSSQDVESDNVNTLDIGLAVGAGVDVGLGPGDLTFDLRYTRGFTSVDGTDADLSIFNSMGSANVGYVIGF